jgi:hypothetical protein
MDEFLSQLFHDIGHRKKSAKSMAESRFAERRAALV